MRSVNTNAIHRFPLFVSRALLFAVLSCLGGNAPMTPGMQAQAGSWPDEPEPVVRVELRSNRAITITTARSRHVETAKAYSLTSRTDSAYRRPLHPVGIGYDQQAVGFDGSGEVVLESRLHLLFAQPLRAGHVYRLHLACVKAGGLDIRFNPSTVSSSIQVNQVGYATHAKKYAYIGNWLGSLGGMPVDDARFEVLSQPDGRVVFDGPIHLRRAADEWSGNHVFEADFSALSTPGRYRIHVPSLGRSYPFVIAPDVNQAVYQASMRLFYHSRNSTPVLAPFADTGHARPRSGIPARLDGVFHPAVGKSVLAHGEKANAYHAVSRGWFDAGDYGQYIPNAAIVWYAVGAALDIAAGQFPDGDLNIPESGDGIPDVLDELQWGMAWALSMQDEHDGGVYFRISSETWDESMPDKLRKPRFIYEKTTHATASFAAMAAIHARLIQSYDAGKSKTVLAAAEAAWWFVHSHPQWPAEGERYRNPKGTHAGEYADASAMDNILWAAAELYRTTGKASYRDAYARLADDVSVDPTSMPSFKNLAMAAMWAYAMTRHSDRDASLASAAEKHVIAGADWRLRMTDKHSFRVPMHDHIAYAGWGSFGQSSRSALHLLQAYYLSGDRNYLRAAWSTPYAQLGANPQSRSYITGIGANPPMHPLSKLSQYDQAVAPLKGIPVFGPHYYLPESLAMHAKVNRAYIPANEPGNHSGGAVKNFAASYPVLRKYADSELLPPMSEATVAEYAYTAMAYGLLKDERLPINSLSR
ncbi:MAG: glycoside hydrolase family 9 protein [Mariprofundaceae bacterium]